MARIKRGFTRHRRHQRVLDQVKGHMTSRGHLFRAANTELMRSLNYAYRDRRTRKRDMRALWIVRINAAAREHGLPYNRFIAGLTAMGFAVDRKMLAEMAVNDPHAFAVIAARIKGEADPAPAAAPPVPAGKAARRAAAQEAASTSTSAAEAKTAAPPVPASAGADHESAAVAGAAGKSEETEAPDAAPADPAAPEKDVVTHEDDSEEETAH